MTHDCHIPKTWHISDDDGHQTQETNAASNVNCNVHQLEHFQRKSLGTQRSLHREITIFFKIFNAIDNSLILQMSFQSASTGIICILIHPICLNLYTYFSWVSFLFNSEENFQNLSLPVLLKTFATFQKDMRKEK